MRFVIARDDEGRDIVQFKLVSEVSGNVALQYKVDKGIWCYLLILRPEKCDGSEKGRIETVPNQPPYCPFATSINDRKAIVS
jgi:hypothetical protein